MPFYMVIAHVEHEHALWNINFIDVCIVKKGYNAINATIWICLMLQISDSIYIFTLIIGVWINLVYGILRKIEKNWEKYQTIWCHNTLGGMW